MRARAAASAWVPVLALALAACGPSGESDAVAVAELGERELTLADLEAYLAVNFPEEGRQELKSADRDLVLSRLFDNFLEEQLLLGEARREGVEVGDVELALYLGLGPGGTAQPELDAERLEQVRNLIMVQKFREQLLSAIDVEPEVVTRYLAGHRDRLVPPRQVVLRSLLLESADQAAEAHQAIRRRRLTFAEAVVAYGTGPGQGVPVEMSLDGLPPLLREAIVKLRPGGVTKPVELDGNVYLFQLEAAPDQTVDEQVLLQRAREELLRARRDEALASLLERLERESELRVLRGNLPFRYVPEPPNA